MSTHVSAPRSDALVDEGQVARFKANGFVLGGQLLSPEDADAVNEIITDIVVNPDNQYHARVYDFKHGGRPLLHIKNMWKRYDIFADMYRNPRILASLQALTGATAFNLWQDRFFYKPADSGGFHTWHQDSSYLPFLRPYTALSAWIALTDATADNGAMRMVPGSHLWPDGTQVLEETAEYASDGRPLPESFAGHVIREVDCPVQKGYVHFHSSSTWHCSLPNWTHAPRCAIAFFYVAYGARFDGENRWAKDYEGEHGEPLNPAYYPLVEVQ